MSPLMFSCAKSRDSSNDLLFELSKDKTSYKVIGYKGNLKEIIIPKEYNGLEVNEIADYAFSNLNTLYKVVLPNSINKIGKNIFEDSPEIILNEYKKCLYLGSEDNPYYALIETPRELETIEINLDCKLIASEAFKKSSIKNIDIPEGIKSISKDAFKDCASINKINIPSSIECIDENVFDGLNLETNEFENVKYLGNDNDPYLIMLDVNDKTVSSLNIANDTKIIYKNAINGLSSLTSLTLPEDLVQICSNAIINSNISSINLPKNVKYFSGASLLNNDNLSHISVDKDNKYFASINGTIYNYNKDKIVKVCDNTLNKFEINKEIKEIGEFAFYNTKIREINFDEESELKIIGDSSFANMANLVNINIPNSITELGDFPFNNCSSLKYNEYGNANYIGTLNNPYFVNVGAINEDIESSFIEDNCVFVDAYAYANCVNLKELTIGRNVINIAKCAFQNCTSLSSVRIPDNVKNIAESAFQNASSIKELFISGNVETIDTCAFKNCTSLTSLTLNQGIKRINNYSFANCYSLKELTLPGSLEIIGAGALKNCSLLGTLNYFGNKNDFLALTKLFNWNDEIPASNILCVDGKIEL